MISEVSLGCTRFNKLPWKFEAGTPHMAGIIGLGEAVDYLSKIGMEKVWEHEQELAKYGLEKLKPLVEEGWVKIYGPKDTKMRGGVISFNVKGVHAHDTAQILDNEGVAVRSGQHCASPLVKSMDEVAVVRASFYIYNTKEEVDKWVDLLDKVREVFL